MKVHPIASRVLACVACALAVVGVVAACLDEGVVNILTDVPFDGGFLDACSDGETKLIAAKDCPAFCSGMNAVATCVGTSYAECSCLPSTASLCDSGCCPTPDFEPIFCKEAGKVVMPDPSEGLCDAENGYLICNGDCYASFSCEIPTGYTVVTPPVDAGHPKDGGKPTEGGGHEAGEAGTVSDSSAEAGEGGTKDAHSLDAPAG